MFNKKLLERMTQEELYQLFVTVSDKIENDTLEKYSADNSAVVPFSNFIEPAMELMQYHESSLGLSSTPLLVL